ncbi:MAG: alginate export family protein [Gemmatimonadetes bacterium]|nr:alginate export family protein [Gemmatimonadota bacterium]
MPFSRCARTCTPTSIWGRTCAASWKDAWPTWPGANCQAGRAPSDRNRGDLGNAFVELAGTLSGARTAARFGRQELLLGRERIISPLDWANVRRVFEGGNVEVRRGALAFSASSVRPLVLRPLRRDIADDVTRLWGTTVAWQPARGGRVLESAVLVKSVRGVGTPPQARRATATTRLVTPIVRPDLALEVEGGVQRVEGTGGATWATMFATDLTWSPARPGSPSVTIGLDRASGTRAGVPAQSGTWDQLYPLGHAYAGFADALGRRNLMEERIVTQFSPTPFVRIRTSAHAFQRASAADAAYDVAGGIFRSASATATSRDVGKEIDVALQWRLASHLRVDGGLARFTPGRFPHQTGSALPYSWIFSSITATF